MALPIVPNDIVWFGYHDSPYAQRVKHYLAFRNIAYAECAQPELLPRPDLEALGINYRRVPVLAIGRDVYLDSRCIVARLETLFPACAEHPPLSRPETVGLAKVLQRTVVDVGGAFARATMFISSEFAMIKRNPGFARDRAGFYGAGWTVGDSVGQRSEAIVHMREVFLTVEEMLRDGREWIAGTEGLGMADFELEWPLDWLLSTLQPPAKYFNDREYPKTFAWIASYRAALEAATERAAKPVLLQGDEAVRFVTASKYTDGDVDVDRNDPLQLEEGTHVEVFPTDGGGFTHQDRGQLVKLTRDEVAIAVQSKTGQEVRVHAPRWNFRIKCLAAGKL